MLLAGRPAAPAPRAAPPRPPAPPKPTASSTFHDAGPTGDYGGHAVTAYKQTPAYHAAITQVFRAQPPAQKAQIIRGLTRQARANPQTFHSPEFQSVRNAWDHLRTTEQQMIAPLIPKDIGMFIAANSKSVFSEAASGISSGLGSVASGLDYLRNAGPSMANPQNVAAAGVPTANSLGRVLTHAPIDVARAAVESPSTIPKTLKGLGENVAGMVAGTVELPIKAFSDGPGNALSQYGRSIAQDYKTRYGPLASGNDRKFINRIKQQGAGPELFDALMVAGGLDATLGRGASSLARVKTALTGEDNALTRPRPDLVLSGNKVRPQELASTAGRAAAQRLEDRVRQHLGARGELKPGEHQVAPIFQGHAMRVVHSGIAARWRRVVQENLRREVRGGQSSALSAIGRLNGWQKQAIYHAVQGVRVDTAQHFISDLADRTRQIEADRARPGSLGRRIPAQHADQVDELRVIPKLMANAEKIAGPKMVAFQRGEAERAARIEAQTALHPATAEARRLRPVGDRLGIEHPDVTAVNADRAAGGRGSLSSALAAARSEAPRTERLAQYVNKVRAEMGRQGLPEPGYFAHMERPGVKYGNFTSGAGHRAMPADKMSTWALHRAGIAWHDPQAYIQGLARSIKRPLQWRLTDEQFRSAALPTATRGEVKAALGVNKQPIDLTGNEFKRVLEHRGYDMSKLAFYNPGRLAEATLADHGLLPKGKMLASEHEDQVSSELHGLLNQHDVAYPGEKVPTDPHDPFLTTPGWKAVPKTAFDEIHAGLKGATLAGRSWGKLQGTTAQLILGQNPHFVIMNTLAHLFPAIMGTKGRIVPDLFKAPFWWHGLSDVEKDRVRGFEGGRGGHYATTARLGSTAPNQIAAFGRQLGEKGLVQAAKRANPFTALLRAEDLQSNFFRHAVMYHEAKRMAFQDMSHEFGRAVSQWEQVKHLFSPGLDPQGRARAIVNDMTKVEALGRTTVNILGDYGRFTAREQAIFKRGVLFYSFLRHVTRTLLYVLPLRHPLAFGLLGELGQLHSNEVRQLLGGQDLPWAYGRVFFDSKGKLSSIDLTSTSPVSSPLVDVLAGGVKELPRLITPALAPLLDISYGQTPIGQPVKQNAYSFLGDLLSLSYPYRMGYAGRFGLRAQQSDSIPFIHERPQNYKTPASQEYQAAKQQARGPLDKYLLGTTLGLYPKPDDARVIAEHMAQKAAAKGAKSKYLVGGASASGSGGYLLGGGGSSGGGSGGYLLP